MHWQPAPGLPHRTATARGARHSAARPGRPKRLPVCSGALAARARPATQGSHSKRRATLSSQTRAAKKAPGLLRCTGSPRPACHTGQPQQAARDTQQPDPGDQKGPRSALVRWQPAPGLPHRAATASGARHSAARPGRPKRPPACSSALAARARPATQGSHSKRRATLSSQTRAAKKAPGLLRCTGSPRPACHTGQPQQAARDTQQPDPGGQKGSRSAPVRQPNRQHGSQHQRPTGPELLRHNATASNAWGI